MALSSANLTLYCLLCLLISLASSHPVYERFLRCLSIHSPPSTNFSQLIYLPNTGSYSSLLRSSIQNLRFASPTIPKPLLILEPADESQIQASVICCRNHSLPMRVRSGGHDYEGLSYRSDHDSRFILLDLTRLRSISVDTEHGVAWVQSGATLGELYYRIAEKSSYHGFPAGICPTVCVGGHLSGGGLGPLIRKYGLAADNVLDATLVDVNGRLLDRESMGEDLFWAIRGGGGASFGIIVSWKVRLVPVPPTFTIFTLHRTLEQGAIELLNKWQYVAHKLHEDLYLKVDIQHVEGGENGVVAVFESLFLGGCAELLQHIGKSFPELEVKRNDCREMTWIQSALYFAGYHSEVPMEILLDRSLQPKEFNKGKSDYAREPIPLSGWEGIWRRFLEQGAGSMVMVPYGGRMGEILEAEIPFPHRQGNLFSIQYLVRWNDSGASASEKHLAWVRRTYRYMSPYVSKHPRAAYLNYRDLDLGKNEEGNTSYLMAKVWGRKYFKNNFKRLAIVKGEVDPEDFFWSEQSIPPLVVDKERRSGQIGFKDLISKPKPLIKHFL
ncbi:berberine bridge enzyme-like 15 [Phoenix dactylifera]|uniref:Berberine bridge enzyme-like 15 n=1 Tax=Phoenix dactylifera TaxID=42345 RepID=A0A8B7C276_PHODC|nr:berberine bridge enzyme-like 15 [Phoenix dactylifera]